jgi:regulator of sigma E protease
MRVDEFAIGFPPKLFSNKCGETVYTINALPFGGYVRIHGENPTEATAQDDDSFTSKNRFSQALVLVAGVVFNILLAWILLWISIMMGFIAPAGLDAFGGDTEDQQEVLMITGFSGEDSPAFEAGLRYRDQITGLVTGCALGNDPVCNITLVPVQTAEAFIGFVEEHQEEEIYVSYTRGTQDLIAKVVPEEGIVEGKKAIGVGIENVAQIKSGPIQAIGQSYILTGYFIKETFVGLWSLIANAVQGEGSLEGVSGPIGIVGIVGGAAAVGFSYLLTLAAVISINLAVINIFPIPALDGGRLVFVLIESITRRPISLKFQVWANTIGFVALMLLMLVLTVFDVKNLF